MFKNDLNISLPVNTYVFNNQKEEDEQGVSRVGPNLGWDLPKFFKSLSPG